MTIRRIVLWFIPLTVGPAIFADSWSPIPSQIPGRRPQLSERPLPATVKPPSGPARRC